MTQNNDADSDSKTFHVPIDPKDNALGGERSKNFFLMIVFYVNLRIGWIFKTESIIMPAVMDSIGGSGWHRGCLSLLNRFGQSVPPLWVSDRVRRMKRKKFCVAFAVMVMGCCFLMLAVIWYALDIRSDGKKYAWLPYVFLALYGLFFSATGISQLATNTLRGKLVPVRRRGQLMLVSTSIGAGIAVLLALFLLYRWVDGDNIRFVYLFTFTGVSFIVGAILTLLFSEGVDQPNKRVRSGVDLFRRAWGTLLLDKNFRLLAIVAATYGMTMTLFPHFQTLARGSLDLKMTAVIPWVIAQNIGAALFSIPTGWIGDRVGYRRVLRVLMLLICVAPILAIILSHSGEFGRQWIICVFIMLGLTPVTFNAFNNYTLELVDEEKHPRYLSTLSMCMAVPAILFAIPLGWLVDFVGFDIVFGCVTVILFCGWLLTWRLKEPRAAL